VVILWWVLGDRGFFVGSSFSFPTHFQHLHSRFSDSKHSISLVKNGHSETWTSEMEHTQTPQAHIFVVVVVVVGTLRMDECR
jgi:hypothetical protein